MFYAQIINKHTDLMSGIKLSCYMSLVFSSADIIKKHKGIRSRHVPETYNFQTQIVCKTQKNISQRQLYLLILEKLLEYKSF